MWNHFLCFLSLLGEEERGKFAIEKREKKGKNRQKEGIANELRKKSPDTKSIFKCSVSRVDNYHWC